MTPKATTTTSQGSPEPEDDLALVPRKKRPTPVNLAALNTPRTEREMQSMLTRTLRTSGATVLTLNDKRIIGIPDMFVGTPNLGIWLENKVLEPDTEGPIRLKHPLSGEQWTTLMTLDMKPLPAAVLVFAQQRGRHFMVVPIRKWKAALEAPRSEWEIRKQIMPKTGGSIADIAIAYRLWSNFEVSE